MERVVDNKTSGKQQRFPGMPVQLPSDLGRARTEEQVKTPDWSKLGLARSIAWSLRRGEQLPESARPALAGLPLAVQIAELMQAWWIFMGREEGTRSADAREIKNYVRLYAQLGEAGVHLTEAIAFRERHAKILLEYWRDKKKCSAATIRVYWSHLMTLTRVLGKLGMVGRLEQYWPEATQLLKSANPVGQRTQDAMLDEQQVGELMRSSDRTHWFVQRLHQELGFSFEEAMRFDRAAAADCLQGRVLADPGAGSRKRIVRLESDAHVLLVQQAVDFLERTGRRQLMWPVSSLDKAVRKHENRVAYLRRKAKAQRDLDAAALAGDGAGGEGREGVAHEGTGEAGGGNV